ncbi:23S rRNA (guanosine(2251)-2'-O)-methyltransferase RlmB [Methylothermus subterraneus]|nr:RNA methyltransferase, TrmH family [uncultured Gammaproteobacteria bacterium]
MRQRLFGLHAVLAVLANGPERVVRAWLDRKRRDFKFQALRERLEGLGIPAEAVERARLDRLAGSAHHQGVVLEVVLPDEQDEEDLEAVLTKDAKSLWFLVLDQAQDPHNLGACLRTCDAVGASGVIVPKDQSCGLTPTVCKVASGAAETMPLYRVTNLARTLRRLKEAGLWIVGAASDGDRLAFAADLKGPLALVLGGEGKGLRRLTREACDVLVRLPMRGTVASLNLAVAAGVLLYEALRQRELGNLGGER